jgi:RNA polymerase sigma-70 factor (ECF subfamily)
MPDDRELQELLESDQPNPESEVLRAESTEQLHRAILKIPPPYRFVLVLHDMEGLNTSEVAKVMAIREGTVRVRLHRARLQLRREVERARRDRLQAIAPQTIDHRKRKPRRCREPFAALSDYMDGLIDDAVCEEMSEHLAECKPCQAFLLSLQTVVKQCEAYDRGCVAERTKALRLELLQKYYEAQQHLEKRVQRPDVGTRRTKAAQCVK